MKIEILEEEDRKTEKEHMLVDETSISLNHQLSTYRVKMKEEM